MKMWMYKCVQKKVFASCEMYGWFFSTMSYIADCEELAAFLLFIYIKFHLKNHVRGLHDSLIRSLSFMHKSLDG